MTHYLSFRETVQQQDTIQHRPDTIPIQDTTGTRHDSARQAVPGTILTLDSLEKQMQAAEQRLQQIDSAEKRAITISHLSKPAKTTPIRLDSAHLIIRSSQPVDRSLSTVILEFTTKDRDTQYMRPHSEDIFIQTKENRISHTERAQQPHVRHRETVMLKESWMFPVLFTAFVLIIWVRIMYGKIFNKTIVSLWNRKAASGLLINRSTLYQRMNIVLFINYLLTGTLFFYLIMKSRSIFFGLRPHEILLVYGALTLAGLFVYGLITTWLTGVTANARNMMNEYFQYTILFFHNVGIYLFPFVVLLPFITPGAVNPLIIAGISLIAGLYLLRLFWLFYLFVAYKFSLFYLFLYLCALEILPLLLFIRLMFS